VAHPPSPTPPAAAPGSRFTRLLFVVATALASVAIGTRLVRGLRTGTVPWLEITLPLAAVLMLAGIMVGPRRRVAYYTLLAAAFALLVTFYATPRHGAAPPRAPAAAGAAR
jgi:hypothetical protein